MGGERGARRPALPSPRPLACFFCQSKWALRQVLYRHVPRALVDRPKQGFSIPLAAWLRGSLRDWAEALLAPQALAADGLLNPVPIRHAWAEHQTGRRDHAHALWAVLMLQAWREAARI